MTTTACPIPPRKQGAGLMSINDAVNTRGYLSVEGMERPKLELKDDPAMKGVYTMNFTVHNTGSDTLAAASVSLLAAAALLLGKKKHLN